MPAARPLERLRIQVRGRVQGVGFRPFVQFLAMRHGLGGFVRNDAAGVLIEVEGQDCGRFVEALRCEAPPLARILQVSSEPSAPQGERQFRIERSATEGTGTAIIPPDVAICSDCLTELFTPGDRRQFHPFITCTQCGPRFTITLAIPYDRERTSMAAFPLCPACAVDYADACGRRRHAEAIACPDCGPQLSMDVPDIVARLRDGQILAIKGLGGFHLAVDARNGAAVERLRALKLRDRKPFAVMVANVASARLLAAVGAEEAAVLADPARPIVVMRSRGALPDAVSGGLPTIGLMLAYTPLHFLLWHEAAGRPGGQAWLSEPQALALVMTSANSSGDPLIIDEREDAAILAELVDAVVSHDRPIVTRADDSVVRLVAGKPLLLRRSRGYVPDPVPLAEDGPPVLALGALLKATATVLRGREAVLSPHVGDLESPATVRSLRQASTHLMSLLDVRPAAIACDHHPDYPSTRLAEAFGVPVVRVQHHHAHLAAVAAEYGITGRLTGWVLDGFGLGTDGTLWGGELMRIDGTGCRRLAHLAPLAMPGGDRAAREPWRMGAAILHDIGRGTEIATRFAESQAAAVAHMLSSGITLPSTTSCGRLFDAAAALLGIARHNAFEGEAAMKLEAACREPRVLAGGWRTQGCALDLSPLLKRLADMAADDGAALFHGTLVEALASTALANLAPGGERVLALAGGCAANRILVEGIEARLAAEGVALLLPRLVPPGDGGLSLGQALVARRKLVEAA